MINLRDAKLVDGVSEVMREQPWARAMSVAVRNQMRLLLDYADRVTLWAAVDTLPDNILDVMAQDLMVPQYSETFPIATKRSLIKGAVGYWSKAGTKRGVEDLCRDIFSDADISEWFEYSGSPGYFKVSTVNPAVTDANVEEFKTAVSAIKRLSAWLEAVILSLSTDNMLQHYGFSVHTLDRIALEQDAFLFAPPTSIAMESFEALQAENGDFMDLEGEQYG